MYVTFNPHCHLSSDHSFLGQANLRHCTKPSAEPPLPTTNDSHNTMLQLGQGTFTHNTAGVPIIVVCAREYSIEGLVGGNGVSRMGRMVKGREDTENNLLETCV